MVSEFATKRTAAVSFCRCSKGKLARRGSRCELRVQICGRARRIIGRFGLRYDHTGHRNLIADTSKQGGLSVVETDFV